MIVLDENIIESQRQLLNAWRIAARQIGQQVGRMGMQDDEIIPLLHSLRRPVFFTRDARFFDREMPHAGHCIVVLSTGQNEVASFVRRFLKHPQFDTDAKRMGHIVAASRSGLRVRGVNIEQESLISWP